MPVIPATQESFGGDAVRITWANMANGDTGEPVYWNRHSDRSIQVKGTFGTGGTVTVQGSNDGSEFVPLTDLRGSNLAINAARIEQIEDCSYAIRPAVTAGDGTTALTVVMFAKKG